MAHISELLRTEIHTESRKDLLMKFVKRMNDDRAAKGMKPMHPVVFYTKMKHLDDWDLKIFYGSCMDAQNFSAYWWWALDPKNVRVL